MKQLPGKFLQSLEGLEGFDREAFEAVHQNKEQVTSIRFNTNKASPFDPDIPFPFASCGAVPWCKTGFYLANRPSFTFDPLFHAGLYYVQEASSMFLEQAILSLAVVNQPLKVLDLCAAPGGKSTHLQSLLPEGSLLVSNEVIRTRSNILVDNLIKWGVSNVIVTNNDPASFQKLTGFFDVIVADAPCSGSGLFRKDNEAIDEWSPGNVELCSQRQQRILADVLPSLKENGLLIYSTCSYSKEEDEFIGNWLSQSMEMEPLPIALKQEWNIVTVPVGTKEAGYRFYPYRLKGEGFFMACFRKNAEEKNSKGRRTKIEKATGSELKILQPWINESSFALVRKEEKFLALPPSIMDDYELLQSVLRVLYAGVELGQVMKARLVPAHALALSRIISHNVPFNELLLEEATRYLQKSDGGLPAQGKGFQLVRYAGQNLGWINVLPNRVNNYYPKELRILKQQNDSNFQK